MPENTDGMHVVVQGHCVVCNDTIKVQQAGVPKTVQKVNRVRIKEYLMACVILQEGGKQPFEIQRCRIVEEHELQHVKLQKYQAQEFLKWVTSARMLTDGGHPLQEVREC